MILLAAIVFAPYLGLNELPATRARQSTERDTVSERSLSLASEPIQVDLAHENRSPTDNHTVFQPTDTDFILQHGAHGNHEIPKKQTTDKR